MNIIQVSKWSIPSELFERYLRVIKSTERSGTRYNYEFDELRTSIHGEIMEYVGLKVHMAAYREFQRALRELCADMLPPTYTPITPTKLQPPRGLL